MLPLLDGHPWVSYTAVEVRHRSGDFQYSSTLQGKVTCSQWSFTERMFTNATRLLHIESMDWAWQFCTFPNGVWLHFLPSWIAYIINISTWIALRLSTCHTFPRHTRKGGKEGRVAGDLTYIVWKVHLTFRITFITDQMRKAAIKGPDECGPIVDFVGAFLDVGLVEKWWIWKLIFLWHPARIKPWNTCGLDPKEKDDVSVKVSFGSGVCSHFCPYIDDIFGSQHLEGGKGKNTQKSSQKSSGPTSARCGLHWTYCHCCK